MLALGSMVYPSLKRLRYPGSRRDIGGCSELPVRKTPGPTIAAVAAPSGRLLVVEENVRMGGLGGGVLELFNDMECRIFRLDGWVFLICLLSRVRRGFFERIWAWMWKGL
jgi:transketolase C-terminal domain/subunit